MKKYRFNPDKFLRNIAVISGVITVGLLVYKVANCGIAWISTIRIFWIERRDKLCLIAQQD